MQVEKKDIAVFISMLYKEKRNEVAPPELLSKWEALTQEDINTNLTTLFSKWGLSDREKEVAIQRFYQKSNRNNTDHITATPSTPTKPPPGTATGQPYHTQNSYPAKKKGTHPIVYLLLMIVIGALGYLAYQYVVYKNLSEVYAITDNIAIRDKDGKITGRMDLYENKNLGSMSKLRTTSSEVYYLKHEHEDKEYPTRKVLMDTVGFIDYLIRKDEVTHFVNTNFVVNNKQEFELYQKTFKEINTVPEDNKRLSSIQRKIIAGSMARTSSLDNKYLISNSQGLNNAQLKNTMPYLIQELRPGQHYVIIAGMNDGNYYRFEGDIKLNEYVRPEPVKVLTMTGQPLLQGAFRFQKIGDVYRLYDVPTKILTYYEARKDAMGKYIAFELNEPVLVPLTDTTTLTPPEELFNQ